MLFQRGGMDVDLGISARLQSSDAAIESDQIRPNPAKCYLLADDFAALRKLF
jgi:hypothetical protein